MLPSPDFVPQVSRERILELATQFVGTPYQHQGAALGAGCDCLGLVRGVWVGLYGWEPPIPPYTPDWGEYGVGEPMIEVAKRYLVLLGEGRRRKDLWGAHKGDVVLFQMVEGRVAKHCAILGEGNDMIHSQSEDKVRKVAMSDPWRRRVVAAFRFPGVSTLAATSTVKG